MPIYEYACRECGHKFERLQRMSEDPVRDCPECEVEGAVKKLVSQTSFVLKGGGWYSDHYGLKSGSSSSEGTSKDASSTHSSSASDSSTSSTTDSASTNSSSGSDD
jgi:putative FmdB family regulatory protein